VDVDAFSRPMDVLALKQERGLSGRRIILFVGRLARRKGVKEFIEHSLVQIVAEIPEAVFLIVGDNPTESLAHRDDIAGEVRAAVAHRKLDGHVRWLGAVSDDELVRIYALADLLVLPVVETRDDVEGFGMVALEAAAAGKPVVATRVGGVPDAVADGESGVLVEAGNYPELTRAVLAVLRDAGTASRLGQSGRERAQKMFSWDVVGSDYKELFAEITRS
jgi:phosphatidylinositol alpha-1,6-mannosyltransferase